MNPCSPLRKRSRRNADNVVRGGCNWYVGGDGRRPKYPFGRVVLFVSSAASEIRKRVLPGCRNRLNTRTQGTCICNGIGLSARRTGTAHLHCCVRHARLCLALVSSSKFCDGAHPCLFHQAEDIKYMISARQELKPAHCTPSSHRSQVASST